MQLSYTIQNVNTQKLNTQKNIKLPWFCYNCQYNNQEILLDNRMTSNQNITIFKNQNALKSVQNLLQKQMIRTSSQNQVKFCSYKNIDKIKESKRSLRQTIRISAKLTTSPTLDTFTKGKDINLVKTTTSTNYINKQWTENMKSRQLQRQSQNTNVSQSNNILSFGNINSFKSLDSYPNQMNYIGTGNWQKSLKNCQMTQSIVIPSANIQMIRKIPSQQNLTKDYLPEYIRRPNTYSFRPQFLTKNIYMKNQIIHEEPLKHRKEHILRNNQKQNESKVNFKESPSMKQKCQYLLTNIRKKSTSSVHNESKSQISQHQINYSQIGKHLKIGIRRVESFDSSSEDQFSQVLSHGKSFLMTQINELQQNSLYSQISQIQHTK